MVVRWPDVLHNIAVFHAYCARHGADIAPHGKTTMNREVFRAQLDAGAWGITVASPAQALVARAADAARIVVANEVTGEAELATLLDLAADPEVEVLTLADSPAGVERLASAASAAGLERRVQVLIEIGYAGGRAGVRDDEALERTLDAIAAAGPSVELRGFEAFEGLIDGPDLAGRIAAVDAFLERLASVARAHRERIDHPDPIVSAGGSAFVDRVLLALGPSRLPGWHLVVRSGVYVTHDSGAYDRLSPLSARAERFRGR